MRSCWILMVNDIVRFPVVPWLKCFCELKLGLALAVWCQSLWNRAIRQISGRHEISDGCFSKKPGHIWTMCGSNSSSCSAWRCTAVSLFELSVFFFETTHVLPLPNQRHQTFLRPITKVPWSSHANTLSEVIPQPSPLMRPTTSDYTVLLKSVLWRVPLQKVDYSGYNSPAALGYYYLRYRL